MTYDDLLRTTHKKKLSALHELGSAVSSKNPLGFLARAELKRDPGQVAYLWLAQGFCETLAEHIDEFIEQEGMDSYTAREMSDIYMAWYDGRFDELYDLLPVEAQLFTEE